MNVEGEPEACTHRERLPDTLGTHDYFTTAKRERDGSWTERVEVHCKVCKEHLSTKVSTDVGTAQENSFTDYHNEAFKAHVTRTPGIL